MASPITAYKCPNCTGPLHYSSGKLECDFCGSTYDVEEIEALYAEKEVQTQKTGEEQQENPAPKEEEQTQWDQSGFTQDWGDTRLQTYSCPSCGAELVCDETTMATSCPYCGNPTVIPGKFAGALKPEYIIPFKISHQQAKEALKKHYKGKIFLPKMFREENRLDEIKGVYVPFWMYDSEAEAEVTAEGQRIAAHTDGKYRVTNTSHYHVERAGTIHYEKIPADASTKMPDDYMDALEPFDYGAMEEFSPAYLPGFLADQYDVSAEVCAERAESRIRSSALSVMQGDMEGYDTCMAIDSHVKLHRGKVHYALLPVYLLSTRWQGKQYLFAMNGQTGKMVSNLPVSRARYWGLMAAITVPLTLVFGTIFYFAL